MYFDDFLQCTNEWDQHFWSRIVIYFHVVRFCTMGRNKGGTIIDFVVVLFTVNAF